MVNDCAGWRVQEENGGLGGPAYGAGILKGNPISAFHCV